MMLTEQQKQHFAEDGYLLVSGLVPPDIARAASDAMHRRFERGGEALTEDDQAVEDAVIAACYTAEVLAAAAELAGGDPDSYRAPKRPYPIIAPPREGEWKWPGPHIDHAIKEHGHHTFPRPFRIASMLFLSDVPPHGGGTVVWPGSAARIESLARSELGRYELMWALNQEIREAQLGEPVELTPRCGDVLFYHYLCAHAGSMNVSDRPRLAMNMKW